MAPVAGLMAWSLGIVVALSFNVWRDVRPLAVIPLLADKGIFDLLDFLIANLMLPTNALLMAIFVAWMMSRQTAMREFGFGDTPAFRLWRIATRYIAPVGILIVLVSTIRENLGM
jgi:NSS family neurotransmitter:Na+ symporter